MSRAVCDFCPFLTHCAAHCMSGEAPNPDRKEVNRG